MGNFEDVVWMTPGSFSKPLDAERKNWSQGIDAMLIRAKRGFTKVAKSAAPSLAGMEKLGPWFQLSRVTGEKLPNGRNRRNFLGAVIHVGFLNPNGEVSKAALAKVREENETIGRMIASGDELVEAEKLSAEDFAARNWKPEECLVLLSPAVLDEEERGLWWHERFSVVSADAPLPPADNLPF